MSTNTIVQVNKFVSTYGHIVSDELVDAVKMSRSLAARVIGRVQLTVFEDMEIRCVQRHGHQILLLATDSDSVGANNANL